MQKQRRGRPATIDPDEVARVAMHLFVERGFESVTMDDIAAAVGASRRSIFRYFPSKNHLVWGGMTEAIDRFQAELAAHLAAGPGRSIASRVDLRAAYARAVTFSAESEAVTRERLILIDANPSLMSHGLPLLGEVRAQIAEVIAASQGVSADDLGPQVLSQALISTSLAVLTWWAVHSEEPPRVVMDRVLDVVVARLSRDPGEDA
ncbi:TetR family transcriptional regulator [Klugiella xanthotipulae]|uniref:TetR family transcriptional regulator n=1 Tax=Klugiella xanthotipulae TaxID=244735 RepID=UPI001154A8B4|nr:TetR family transcriptional regulator [Klugiella xanthotipulae]